MNLNDSSIFIINRDLVLLFLLAIVLTTLCKAYKYKYPHSFSSSLGRFFYQHVVDELYWALIVITLLRAFFVEMYIIPSASMQPNLYAGDFVLVNKFAYGIKMPGTNATLISYHQPKIGDVVVFLDPKAPTKRKMIKRLIGVPGDNIQIHRDTIVINGEKIEKVFNYESFDYLSVPGGSQKFPAAFYTETLGDKSVSVEHIPSIMRDIALDFTVPPGHYFVMGDNREYSEDSRFWGFVPERMLCGQASMVLLSIGKTNGVRSQSRVGFLK